MLWNKDLKCGMMPGIRDVPLAIPCENSPEFGQIISLWKDDIKCLKVSSLQSSTAVHGIRNSGYLGDPIEPGSANAQVVYL